MGQRFPLWPLEMLKVWTQYLGVGFAFATSAAITWFAFDGNKDQRSIMLLSLALGLPLAFLAWRYIGKRITGDCSYQSFLEHYVKGVQFPEVSGFEVLELLDVRSRLAALENQLDEAQRAQLEEADRLFRDHALTFYESVAAVGNLSDIRRRAAVPRSHWWWDLEQLVIEALNQAYDIPNSKPPVLVVERPTSVLELELTGPSPEVRIKPKGVYRLESA